MGKWHGNYEKEPIENVKLLNLAQNSFDIQMAVRVKRNALSGGESG